MNPQQTATSHAYFGGGCFWCVEAIYRRVTGVVAVRPGYMGGSLDNPTYEQVCSGNTGHAEVVEIEFEPTAVSYLQLLEIFFRTHNPTELNRQGNDVGTQYRSSIFTVDAAQDEMARSYISELESSQAFDRPIVTTVEAAPSFFPAEDYHQDYFARNPNQPYCVAVVAPKVKKFEQSR